MLIYVIIAIGALWGIFTFIAIREEDKEIQEMIQSARNHIKNSQLPDQDLEDR
jgi:uncharacterized membrane protein YuzA (DUF378 family)